MKVSFEYGQGLMMAELPDSTDIFIPGETVPDPSYIPEDQLMKKTLESIHNPVGIELLSELTHKSSRMIIIFPGRVKGGEQPTSRQKISIKLILEELCAAGVEKKDVLLICSNDLHRKSMEAEIKDVLGVELFNEFWYTHQIINHDGEDYDHLVDLGTTDRGDPIIMNKYVYDSNVAILVSHAQGNPYGDYSGSYRHCATGVAHWRSIAFHHVPEVIHRKDFTPVSGKSLMRTRFDEIGQHMEKCMGKEFFCCGAVLDTKSRQIEVNSGYATVMQPESWQTADKRTYVPWAEKRYDVTVSGMPQFFHYGEGMGTNPIMVMQALSAQVIRHKRTMSDDYMIIYASICNGYSHKELWPYLPRMYEMFQHNQINTLPDVNRYGEYFATNEEYIHQYRYCNAFHPFHGFSMISCRHIAGMNTSAIYICGAQEPGYARDMGLKTRVTVEETLEDAKRKYVGPSPNVLALPPTFKTAAVHLVMRDNMYKGKGDEDCGCMGYMHHRG